MRNVLKSNFAWLDCLFGRGECTLLLCLTKQYLSAHVKWYSIFEFGFVFTNGAKVSYNVSPLFLLTDIVRLILLLADFLARLSESMSPWHLFPWYALSIHTSISPSTVNFGLLLDSLTWNDIAFRGNWLSTSTTALQEVKNYILSATM